jgi:hypothetical protein
MSTTDRLYSSAGQFCLKSLRGKDLRQSIKKYRMGGSNSRHRVEDPAFWTTELMRRVLSRDSGVSPFNPHSVADTQLI